MMHRKALTICVVIAACSLMVAALPPLQLPESKTGNDAEKHQKLAGIKSHLFGAFNAIKSHLSHHKAESDGEEEHEGAKLAPRGLMSTAMKFGNAALSKAKGAMHKSSKTDKAEDAAQIELADHVALERRGFMSSVHKIGGAALGKAKKLASSPHVKSLVGTAKKVAASADMKSLVGSAKTIASSTDMKSLVNNVKSTAQVVGQTISRAKAAQPIAAIPAAELVQPAEIEAEQPEQIEQLEDETSEQQVEENDEEMPEQQVEADADLETQA